MDNNNATAEGMPESVKQSLDILKATKEMANIGAVPSSAPISMARSLDSGILPKDAAAAAHIETVFENVGMDKTVSSETPLDTHPPHEISNTMASSESGRMNKLRDHSSNIFPAGIMGCKEDTTNSSGQSPRRFIDATEASRDTAGHIDATPHKMPSGVKSEHRNPVTGSGVDCGDEPRKNAGKKKDGNPLLGEGYDKKASSSSTRIPPGGFSHGLW